MIENKARYLNVGNRVGFLKLQRTRAPSKLRRTYEAIRVHSKIAVICHSRMF